MVSSSFMSLVQKFEMVALLLCHLAFFNETRAQARMHLKYYYVWIFCTEKDLENGTIHAIGWDDF